jgi:hypothetical protein
VFKNFIRFAKHPTAYVYWKWFAQSRTPITAFFFVFAGVAIANWNQYKVVSCRV